jgi:hypothetical protein
MFHFYKKMHRFVYIYIYRITYVIYGLRNIILVVLKVIFKSYSYILSFVTRSITNFIVIFTNIHITKFEF